jgi:hypothetical protein
MERAFVPVVLIAVLGLSHGCATGLSEETGTGGGGGTHHTTTSSHTGAHGGAAGAAGTGGSAGAGATGGGGNPQCGDDVNGECLQAFSLGNVATAGTAQSPVGQVPTTQDSDWYEVTFTPTGPATFGGGTPHVTFAVNTGDTYVFDVVPDCTGGSSPACNEGGTAAGVTDWSFVDDQSTAGATQWSTRNVPWPTPIYVRVYRSAGSGCEDYQLSVTR